MSPTQAMRARLQQQKRVGKVDSEQRKIYGAILALFYSLQEEESTLLVGKGGGAFEIGYR